MLSKLIKQKIQERYGREVRYPKDCDSLAEHISSVCNTRLSASTLRRLYGFVKNIREPRMHTLDILSEYLGYKSWEELLLSFEKGSSPPEKVITSLEPKQVKEGQVVILSYEPGKKIELRKAKGVFVVISSNEKRLILNDEVMFRLLEVHYPITLTFVLRKGESLGKLQLATVSGITAIRKA